MSSYTCGRRHVVSLLWQLPHPTIKMFKHSCSNHALKNLVPMYSWACTWNYLCLTSYNGNNAGKELALTFYLSLGNTTPTPNPHPPHMISVSRPFTIFTTPPLSCIILNTNYFHALNTNQRTKNKNRKCLRLDIMCIGSVFGQYTV